MSTGSVLLVGIVGIVVLLLAGLALVVIARPARPGTAVGTTAPTGTTGTTAIGTTATTGTTTTTTATGGAVKPCAKPTPPKAPAWAKAQTTSNAKKVSSQNAAAVRGPALDVVLYGDSITHGMARTRAATWNRHFAGLRAEPLGVSGDTVENLAGRLAAEKPAKDPGVVAYLIGTNNQSTDPVKPLDWVLKWTRAAMPASRVIVMGLLPRVTGDKTSKNKAYADLARAYGATYVDCGARLNPRDPRLFPDGLHLSPAGYDAVLPCLRAAVDKELRRGPACT